MYSLANSRSKQSYGTVISSLCSNRFTRLCLQFACLMINEVWPELIMPLSSKHSPLLCPQTSWRYELLSESGKWISARIENCTFAGKKVRFVFRPLYSRSFVFFFPFSHDMQVWLYSWVLSELCSHIEHGKISDDSQLFRTLELVITNRISSFLDWFPTYI